MANKSYIFLLFEWNDRPIAMSVIGRQISRNTKKGYRLSRLVVLPDYQGLGIGRHISDFCAGIMKNEDAFYYIKTVSPALGEYNSKRSDRWKPTAFNGKVRVDKKRKNVYTTLRTQSSYCHQYIGEAISGYEELLLPVGEMRDKKNIKIHEFF
jgi:GNAT superfamily N-acetyltransferase